MAQAATAYDTLNLETYGPETGDPVVLLHGWGSSAALMQPVALALADRYRVYALDMPGHGRSPIPVEPIGVPEQAGLVFDFVREVVGKPVTLIGHSNGGRIALYMASEPDMALLVRRLVLVSPSGIMPRRSGAYHVRRGLARLLKAPFRLLPEPLRAFGLDWLRHSLVWKALGSSDYRHLEGAMRETFVKTVNFYLDDRVQNIEAPVLLFWGDKDEAISRYQMSVLEKRIPDAGLVVLENAGHYGYLDNAGVFHSATRYFLENT